MATTLDDIMDSIGALHLKVDALLKQNARPTSSGSSSSNGGVAVFPNYGRRKGEPVFGAAMDDLDYYANGCRRSLADPAKARWHDKERTLLAAIEAEIARQSGGSGGASAADQPEFGSLDDDIPFDRIRERA